MANAEHLKALKQGVKRWNNWRHENPDLVPDLSAAKLGQLNLRGADLGWAYLCGTDLSKADLVGADLRGADLREADLSGASLRGELSRANLSRAKLRKANLTEANLRDANLREADLRDVDLRNAHLVYANLRAADLAGADFSEALAAATNFTRLDLSTVSGLETVHHSAPSSVGIDTIYQSRGKIPEVFLRGCGVPDDLIGYIKSIAGAIQFYSCFISYSTYDQEFAERLYNDLQGNGVRCWFAPHDIKGGRKIHEQLDEAIRLHDKLLLILSEHSMNSTWVKTEIASAREREEQEHKQVLFPITLSPFEDIKKWKLFDADRGIDSAREVREYFIPDFSNWKDHDSYQRAFQRLVKDLKSDANLKSKTSEA